MAQKNPVRKVAGVTLGITGVGLLFFGGWIPLFIYLLAVGGTSAFIMSGKNYRADRLLGP